MREKETDAQILVDSLFTHCDNTPPYLPLKGNKLFLQVIDFIE